MLENRGVRGKWRDELFGDGWDGWDGCEMKERRAGR